MLFKAVKIILTLFIPCRWRVPPKHVALNQCLYCCVCYVFLCWFYEWEIWLILIYAVYKDPLLTSQRTKCVH